MCVQGCVWVCVGVCVWVYIDVVMIAVNKQLADKERVAAAMENDHLLELVNQCLKI